MRLYNALIQYSPLVLVIFFIHLNHGHEATHQHAHLHHNHEDPVTAKHSETTTPVNALHKSLETPNAQSVDLDKRFGTLSATIEQHSDDEHEYNSVEARLRAKHDLRNSVHAHVHDEKHENEQEHIDRLNAPFESEYYDEPEPLFQYEIPPLSQLTSKDTSDNGTLQQKGVPNDTVSVHDQLATPPKTESIQKQFYQDTVPSVDASAKETLKQNQLRGDVPPVQKPSASSTQTPIIQKQFYQDTVPSVDDFAEETVEQYQAFDDIPPEQYQSASSTQLPLIQKQPYRDTVPSVDAVAKETVKQNQVFDDVPEVQYESTLSTPASFIQKQSPPDVVPPVDTIAKEPTQQVREQDNVQVPPPTQNKTVAPIQKPVDQVLSSTEIPATVIKQSDRTQEDDDMKLQSQFQHPIADKSPPVQTKSDQVKPLVDSVVNNTAQNGSSARALSNQRESLNATKPGDALKNDTTQPIQAPDVTKQPSPLAEAQSNQSQSNEKVTKDSAQQFRTTNEVNQPSVAKAKPNEQLRQIVPDEVKPVEIVHSEVPSQESIHNEHSGHNHIKPHTPTPSRILRSATSRIQQAAHARLRHAPQTEEKQQEPKDETEEISIVSNTENQHTENLTVVQPLPSVIKPNVDVPVEQKEQPILPRATHEQPENPRVNVGDSTSTRAPELVIAESKTKISPPSSDTELDEDEQELDDINLPRQVHVHDHVAGVEDTKEPNLTATTTKEDSNKSEKLTLDEEVANSTVSSFLVPDVSPHLPRIHESEEIQEEEEEEKDAINRENRPLLNTVTTEKPANTSESTLSTNNTNATSIGQNVTSEVESQVEEANNTNITQSVHIPPTSVVNKSNEKLTGSPQQVCWRLPKPLEPSVELIENQILRIIRLLPEFIQTVLFGRADDRETLWNRVWFGSIGTMCALFSFLFLTMGTRRLKQNKQEKEIRSRCQQLQQYNNQIELERATFERQNQKLSDEIDELRNLPARDTDEDLFQSREECARLHADLHIARVNYDAFKQDNDYKQSLIQRHEFDLQKQEETMAHLNAELLGLRAELDKTRTTLSQLQSSDMSVERFEHLQEIIQQQKSETGQLKQDKFAQSDIIQELHNRVNKSDVENNELTIKLKQLKDLLEQRDETLARIREKMLTEDGETATTELGDLLSTVNDNSSNSEDQRLLSTVDNDIEKANQHMRDLHTEIEERTRRIKELDKLLGQEKDRCREMETKLKVVLELRERDAHLHIRQLGQTDAELRKARTDTDRVRILQQQLELKQQQLNDVQKVLATDQTKFSDERSKLQHETHEKWMEVKRVTRELETSRKECEGLRRQITKYANSERSSQEKTMLKPVPQHISNTGRPPSEPETNGSSPPPLPYSQGENFRPIDNQRGDSGALSPAEMFRTRPPMFGLHRPPFYPPPFMPPPPPNPFMMGARFPLPMGGPHGMISPIAHLMTNGGGSDANSFELVDSTNITPNSISFDPHLNGSAVSPTPDDEQQQPSAKPKKAKKSTKKKTKTSTTTDKAAPGTKEDV